MSEPGRRAPEGWSDLVGDYLTLVYADGSDSAGTLISVWSDHLVLETTAGNLLIIPKTSLSGAGAVV